MDTSQKNEIRLIFKEYEETNYRTDLVLFNNNNRHLFVDYKELDIQKIECFLVNQSLLKDKKCTYNYDAEQGIMTSYTLATFFSKCSERFGEKQAKILSNLFFYCYAKFNLFHLGNSSHGILHCDMIV